MARAGDFIVQGASARYFKGVEEPSPSDLTAWQGVDFDDSSWLEGPMPIFYGEPLTGSEVPDMRGLYSTVYSRQVFDVAEPADIQSLTLRVLIDDGFIAYLNGREVVRTNVDVGMEHFDGHAITAYAEPLPYVDYEIANPAGVLRKGRNVLAIMGFNQSLSGSSDFVLDPSLSFTRDDTAPVIDRIIPPAGAVVREFSSVEIQFSEPVNGVDAGDLLINGLAATNVTEFGAGQFVFTFPAVQSGPVTVGFIPKHGITDRSASAHPFAGGSWTFTVDANSVVPGVIINEFMTSDDKTLRDDEGDKSDWIELFNAGAAPASLAGWRLTDTPSKPAKWVFPAITLQPNSYLLIFASGKNRTNSTSPLHTNFKLSSDGGSYLVLANAGGQIVNAFTNYPAQLTDVSYGRANGAPNVVGYFPKPTPGSANTQSGAGFAPPINFSEPSRTYIGAITIALSTTNANTVIHYTTDGTLPTESSPTYSGPISFTNSVARLRARGFMGGLLPGPVRGETYIGITTALANFTSDLPVMILHDFNAGRPPAGSDTYASMQLFMPGTNGITSLTNLPSAASRSVIGARGSSTEGYPKVSLKLELQDEFGDDLHIPLAGMPSESDWVLYAPNNFEPILIHNPFAHQLSRDIGRYSPRTRFVEVYLVTSGTGSVQTASYNGIYVLEEKIKIDNDRVDIPKLAPQESTPPRITGGYLMKVDRLDPGDGGFYAAGMGMAYVDPKEEEILQPERAAQRDYLQTYMDSFGDALYGESWRDPVRGYASFIDTGSWIDHHLMNVLTFNVDALRLSAYFYKQRSGKLHFGPLWDFDRALNSTDGRDANPRVWRSQSSDLGTDFFNYPWWGTLFTDPDFFQAYIDRYEQLRTNYFSTTNLYRLTEDLCNQVRKAQPREQAKWGSYAAPRGSYQTEVNSLKLWLSNRVSFMDSQFVKAATLNNAPTPVGTNVASGYQVTLTVPAGATVYYTLDGSDPRQLGTAFGTNIAANARQYGGPITVTTNTRVVARARNAAFTALTGPNNPPLKSIWSAPVAATFVVNPFPIAVSEIMYHPMGDGPDNGSEADDFEFLELLNTGSITIDLTGFKVKGGIDFTFAATNAVKSIAAGAHLLLVKNYAAFTNRYPNTGPIAGVYSGNLGNDGNRIALFGPLEEPVFDFSYQASWQTNTDGAGRSLVLKNEASTAPTQLGDPASWRASTNNNGSPGAADPAPAAPIELTATATATGVTLRFSGSPNTSYILQRRADLTTGQWDPLQTVTAGADGAVQYTDTFAGNANYYRVQGN